MAKFPKYKIDPGSEVKATGNGYLYVTTTPDYAGDGIKMPDHKKTYVYLHVLVMEKHIGRYLKDSEEVHHKDEDPTNNRLSNLELKSRSSHSRGHAKKNKFWKKSPLNKPKKAMAQHVASDYLQLISGD
jgi:HNH endonuclease